MATIKECREALQAVAVGTLPGSGLIEAGDIKPFRTARFSNNPTHLVIFCPGQMVEPITLQDQEEGYIFLLKLLARYHDETSEETAEDYIDDLENLLVDALIEAQETDEWSALDFFRPTRRQAERIGGKTYKTSDILIKLTTR